MIINKDDTNVTKHVEFVKYTGKWPNLCRGILTLKIDGREVRFGYSYDGSVDHDRFWRSGGECSMRTIQHGEWIIDVNAIPEQYRGYAAEIDEVFNQNVERGCCGGCR